MRSPVLWSLFLFASPAWLLAEEEKPEEKVPPKIAMCNPLAVLPGQITKMIIRGWALDKVTDVQGSDEGITFKLIEQKAAPVPGGQNAMRIGDTQVLLEVTAAESFAKHQTELKLTGPGGESATHVLLVGGAYPIATENEPNDGFRQAQPVSVPQIIDGEIHADRNVDVYCIEMKESGKLRMELFAQRHGSELDAILTLFNEQGTIIAVQDDLDNSRDAGFTQLLTPGKYFLSLQDANDRGGPAHPYRLIIRSED